MEYSTCFSTWLGGGLLFLFVSPPAFLCAPPNSGISMELRWRGLCPHSLQVWVTEGRHTPGPWQLCFPHLSTPPSRWLIVWLMRTVLKGRRGFTAMVTWALSSSASPGWGLQGLGWDPGWLLRAGLVAPLHLFSVNGPLPLPAPQPRSPDPVEI